MSELNIISITFRLLLSMILGGILGIDRVRKKRPAGLRTYMIVCIGSTLVMLTNQYIVQNTGNSDPTRIAAQVISGIGFLGAGTIIVTGHNQVKGLTTAAGLWASAAIGLAVGVGFYEGAVLFSIALFIVMNSLQFLDRYISAKSRIMTLYIEFSKTNKNSISNFLSEVRSKNMIVYDFQINKIKGLGNHSVSVTLTIEMDKSYQHTEVLGMFSCIEGVTYIEELQ